MKWTKTDGDYTLTRNLFTVWIPKLLKDAENLEEWQDYAKRVNYSR